MIIEKGKDYEVKYFHGMKVYNSEEAHYVFNPKTGFTVTWGKTPSEDPMKFPSPNILDLEVTTKCTGGCNTCYKSNTFAGKYMTFDTFKKIFDIIPKSITQIAFGADYDLSSNPDLWKMMEYARNKGIIPNITTVYVNDETADKLAEYCGAVAISLHPHLKNAFDICYDSVKRLIDRGMDQINIHVVLEKETYQDTLKLFNDRLTDPRLSKLNAIVCLSLKQKGRGVNHHIINQEEFNRLVDIAKKGNFSIGFDTCSAKKALISFKNDKEVSNCVERCESTLSSSYINVDGEYFPCSFTEGTEGWERGIDVLTCKNTEEFIDKVWNNPRTEEFRKKLIEEVYDGCRNCPIYNV